VTKKKMPKVGETWILRERNKEFQGYCYATDGGRYDFRILGDFDRSLNPNYSNELVNDYFGTRLVRRHTGKSRIWVQQEFGSFSETLVVMDGVLRFGCQSVDPDDALKLARNVIKAVNSTRPKVKAKKK
jgi:hypothetical protein